MLRKITAAILMMLLLFSTLGGQIVLADDEQPMGGMICPICETGYLLLHVEWTDIWEVISVCDCEHHNYGQDVYMKNYGQEYRKCTECDYRYNTRQVYRYDWFCFGYD